MEGKISLACRVKDIVCITSWDTREAEVMKDADAGSQGPWLLHEKFQIDFTSYTHLLSRCTMSPNRGKVAKSKKYYFSTREKNIDIFEYLKA